jgi:iron(III) transport system ATP-binding protein
MDEPFSSLDDRLREGVRQQTMDLLRETGTTTIVVTHDPDEAMRIADRIALLHQGWLEQCGRPEELYRKPSTMFAARFFSDINEVCGVCRHGRVHTPLGSCAAPHLAERATASVCIRPQHVRVTTGDRGIRARVLSTVYLGETDHVSLAVNGLDRPLTLRAFGPTGMQPGDTVHLEVRPEDLFLAPHDHASRAAHGPTPGVA